MPPRTPSFLILLALLAAAHCQVCTGAAFFDGQRCVPCATNCQCSQEGTCSSCLSGYTYDALFQNCLQCPTALDAVNIGCNQCCYKVEGPGLVCSSCPAGDYVFQQGGQCLKVDGCLSLSSQGVCSSCADGFYLSQGVCAACDISCSTCLDSSVCSICNTAYFNGTNVNNAHCQACSTGCSTCSDATICSACMSGYRINSLVCAACTANCATCSVSSCLTCTSGAVLVATGCYVCTDVGQQGSIGCISCLSAGGRIECTACASGYYLDPSTKVCATCASKFSNSILCTFDYPLQCSDDAHATLTSRFYLVSGQCVANANRCKSMSNTAGSCSLCYFTATEGYYSLAGGICNLCSVTGCKTYTSICQCLSCNDGYQFINSQCNSCQTLHCNICQASVTACQTCAVTYGRLSSACILCQPANCDNCDGDSSICTVCSMGYFLNSGQCYSCQTNCLSCTSNILCTSCSSTHYLQANGRCKTLPSNCLSIDKTKLSSNVGACKRCDYGYILLDGNCYPCGISLFNVSFGGYLVGTLQ